jgi:hypothetical protein
LNHLAEDTWNSMTPFLKKVEATTSSRKFSAMVLEHSIHPTDLEPSGSPSLQYSNSLSRLLVQSVELARMKQPML